MSVMVNLVLHGIDEPHLWHGNSLTDRETFGGMFQGASLLFEMMLTNPSFGSKEGKEAQTRFAYKNTKSNQAVRIAEEMQVNIEQKGKEVSEALARLMNRQQDNT